MMNAKNKKIHKDSPQKIQFSAEKNK